MGQWLGFYGKPYQTVYVGSVWFLPVKRNLTYQIQCNMIKAR